MPSQWRVFRQWWNRHWILQYSNCPSCLLRLWVFHFPSYVSCVLNLTPKRNLSSNADQLACGRTTSFNNTYFYNPGFPASYRGGNRLINTLPSIYSGKMLELNPHAIFFCPLHVRWSDVPFRCLGAMRPFVSYELISWTFLWHSQMVMAAASRIIWRLREDHREFHGSAERIPGSMYMWTSMGMPQSQLQC